VNDELDVIMPCNPGEVCEHGGLKRKCDICWARWELDAWKKHAAQAEADRDTLAAEVRAWRDADASHKLLEAIDACDVYGHRHGVENAQKEVDASNALTRAKEAK
jgi:hypothetical protein